MPTRQEESGGRGAILVGTGIFASRVAGLVRERVFAYYFGNSAAAAAFKAALRIPNVLQNLLGEGVLSASFIPVYAGLLGRGARADADRAASAVFGLLSLAVTGLVAVGMLATPLFIDVVTPGFHGETRALAIRLVRILFPGTGLLVLSAWCLGVLNSHRRFLLSYTAPVAWNLAIIGALVGWGGRVELSPLAVRIAYGAVVGSALQCLVQVPTVLGVLGVFRPTLAVSDRAVRQVFRNLVPLVVSRGVVQVSAYVDTAYASLISERALAALSYAQTLYLIPMSLFGMAVSAAELPELARATGAATDIAATLRRRIDEGLERIAFFVVPSAVALLLLGDIVAGALLQTGRFTAADTRYVWSILMGAAIGLVAGTMGRLYSSAFYALNDTRTPLAIAAIRVVVTALLAYWCAVRLPSALGVPRAVGAVGITASTGVVAWLEFALLRGRLAREIGRTGLVPGTLGALWGAATAGAGLALGLKHLLLRTLGTASPAPPAWAPGLLGQPATHPALTALVPLVPYGLAYVTLAAAFRVPLARRLIGRAVHRR